MHKYTRTCSFTGGMKNFLKFVSLTRKDPPNYGILEPLIVLVRNWQPHWIYTHQEWHREHLHVIPVYLSSSHLISVVRHGNNHHKLFCCWKKILAEISRKNFRKKYSSRFQLEHAGKRLDLNYYPNEGISFCHFPYWNQKDYTVPYVMVQPVQQLPTGKVSSER